MVDSTESDAALAMRIQQEEFARSALASNILARQTRPPDISAPLLDASNNGNINHHNHHNDDNPLLLNGGGGGDNQDNYRNMNNEELNNLQGNARRARRNAIGTVREADSDSPRILLLRIAIAMVEIIATSTVLAIGWDEGASTSCDYLKWWVLIFTYRHFITIPFRILIFRYNRQQHPLAPQPQPQPQEPPQQAAQPELLNENDDNHENANHAVDDNVGLRPPQPVSITVAQKSVQILRWLTIASFLLFLVGHTILVTESECKYMAPVVWYYCLVIIIFVWISLSLPFWIVLAICICLPCVLIIFRFFAEPGGANEQTIKDLPTRKITAADLAKHASDATTETTDARDEQSSEHKQENGDDENASDDEDAPSCAICMQLYKVDDELRILPCQHEFHCECVDRWLQMNVKCPLCRHDITRQAAASAANRSNADLQSNANASNNNDENV
eukprot:CAMPEP_0202692984 /NCGR_PEP_ID=MMETSP1385-20130828/7217_1 /ASSEMBLY_ACC=CAM_ASM_000861 /TAXON_ID=933848 /ORGANISM="Elphidium margaritaceum" /LENGTH=447 /DNA_ID=CAMNT_0049348601 /DNA_START=32 /DNA_END=1375 /DNA_ORIENTATION=+